MDPRKPKIRIVVIDDDKDVLDSFINQFSDEFEITGFHWRTNSTLDAVVKRIDEGVAIVVADLKMPRVTGTELLSRLRKERPEIVRILLTAYVEADSLVESINEASIFYFLAKPILDEDGARLNFRLAGERYRRERRVSYQIENLVGREARSFDALIGDSPKMRGVIAKARRVVNASTTVLLLGETGTGKDLLARAIHYEGPRRQQVFADMNCGLFNEELVESYLFGHEKGAFTSAVQQKRGKLEIADGGTVFLDEVGELAPAIQAKLLRVLETRAFERLGGVSKIEVDVRLIAATNRDLEEAIQQGLFRRDLFYRLAVFPIVMPPLRERREDIEALARNFLAEFNATNKSRIGEIAGDAIGALQQYNYPGNVRELRNAIEYAALWSDGERIEWQNLPETIKAADEVDEAVEATGADLKSDVREFRCKRVLQALPAANQNRTLAAKKLGISTRYLHSLIKECVSPKKSGPPAV